MQKINRLALIFVALVLASLFLCGCSAQQSLTLATMPTKTQYQQGEALDLAGGKLILKFLGGSTEIDTQDSRITFVGFDTTLVGEQTVTLSFPYQKQMLTATYLVMVHKAEPPAPVRLFVAAAPTKTEYVEGQMLNLEGLQLFAVFEDERRVALKKDFEVSICGALSVADGVVTISYQNLTATFYISVKPKVKTKLILSKSPTKQAYLSGEKLDLAGAEICYLMNDGSQKLVSIATELVGFEQVLKFGMRQATLKDRDGLSLNIEISVAKREVAKSEVPQVLSCVDGVNKMFLKGGSYLDAYISVAIGSTNSCKIQGKNYAIFPNQIGERVPQITIAQNGHVEQLLAFCWQSGTPQQLQISLFFLQSLGQENILIETDEEKIKIEIFNKSQIKIQDTGSALKFIGVQSTESFVAVIEPGANIAVKICEILFSYDDYFINQKLTPTTLVWVGGQLAQPI